MPIGVLKALREEGDRLLLTGNDFASGGWGYRNGQASTQSVEIGLA